MIAAVMGLVIVSRISKGSSIPTTVGIAPDAPPQDRLAATQLVDGLNAIATRSQSGKSPYTLLNVSATPSVPIIAVGYQTALLLGIQSAALDALGAEGFVVSSTISNHPGSIVVSGSKAGPRGTLYGMDHFLEAIGVTFVSSDVTILPASVPPSVPDGLDRNFTPGLEYREQYSTDCMLPGSRTADFNVHRRLNKGGDLDQAHGNQVVYATPPGFVHTSYALLGSSNNRPPQDLWNTHREWFWPRTGDGSDYGQLCWSNSSLVQFVLNNVKQFLRSQPQATIISVSQNDNYNYCKSPEEIAIINEEGTPGGALFRAVNVIAEGIKDEFPHVAVDTLAYQWSRPAPKHTKPVPNVIIRLCSIECNFGAPLTDPSNAPFQTDIVNWGKISQRTYIWNYITNFGHYLAPFPDWFSLGPNVKFYVSNGVQGIFQEGSYSGPGGDMAELKTYVLSKMMYDPTLDPDALISEFLTLYYGAAAAIHVREYLDVMHKSVNSTGYYMHENFDPTTAPFLTPDVIIAGGTAFRNALAVATGDEEIRVQCSMMAIYWVAMFRWAELIDYAKENKIDWPLAPSLEEAFDEFAKGFNETAARYGGQLPAFREGGGPGNLTALHDELFPPCPPGWARSEQGICGPLCSVSRQPAVMAIPVNVSASSFYKEPPSISGRWTAVSYPPQWIEFELSSRTIVAAVVATTDMVPSGDAEHVVSVNGNNVTTWSGNMTSGQILSWIPKQSTAAQTIRLTTIKSPSWVAWAEVNFYTC